VRIMDVLPTPVSPSNSTLYVTSFPASAPPVDDDIRDDDVVVVDDDVDDDEIRPCLSRHILASLSCDRKPLPRYPVVLVTRTCGNVDGWRISDASRCVGIYNKFITTSEGHAC